MQEIKISSNLIDWVSYQDRILCVKLNDKEKRLLAYNNISKEFFEEFIASSEPDEFFTNRIKAVLSCQRMA